MGCAEEDFVSEVNFKDFDTSGGARRLSPFVL